MSEYWFEPRRTGYGASPTHWKGAVFLFAFILAVGAGTPILIFAFGGAPYVPLAYVLGLTAVFLRICRKKTNGPWRWR